jgi:hypothetical protein
MNMKKILFTILATTFFSNLAYSESEQSLLAKVNQVYVNYSNAHIACDFQAHPTITTYPQQGYLLKNPYGHASNEINSINFKIRNFVLDGHSGSGDASCGILSIKCASLVSSVSSSNFYCERLHNGSTSDSSLLDDPSYTKYIAYQTIYNRSVMPTAQKNFGTLKQFAALKAFTPYSSGQIPNPDYQYNAVIYSAFVYPDPTDPLSPNYDNGGYGTLFLGSAENLVSVCQTIQNENLSLQDAAVRFNQFFGISPDSPDVVRSFTFFKLRNNPHISGLADGNMFRPCPNDGNIETTSCSGSALTIPHDCNIVPPAYDGTSVDSFLPSYFYSSYCNTTPNSKSGMPVLFPWTGQGFTYDWYPWHTSLANVQGASEYVPATNGGGANIEVANKKSTADFLATCHFN